MLPNSPIEQISRTLSDLEKRIERLERRDQVFTINPAETVINEAGIDRDLRIEGNTESNLLFIDAGSNRFGVGTVPTQGDLVHFESPGNNLAETVLVLENPNVANWVNTVLNFLIAGISRGSLTVQRTAGTNAGVFLIRPTNVGGVAVRALDIGSVAVVVNENGGDIDFRAEGTGDPNLIFGDAGNDNVGIGTNVPNASAKLDISSTTGSLLIPRMTTAQRNALGAVNGMGIYNTTTNQFEKYQAGAWVAW